LRDAFDSGSFSSEELLQTITQSRGEGMDARLADWARFLSGAVKSLLARRDHSESGQDSDSPAIFFLGPPPSDLDKPPIKRRLLSQGIVDFTGSMWFMNVDASVGSFVAHELSGEDLLEHAKSNVHLQSLTALLYIPSATASPLVFFRKGVGKEDDERREYDFSSVSTVSPSSVKTAIDRLYEESLKTPNGMYGSVKLWKSGTTFDPIPDTEKAIQALVRSTFIGAFPGLHATEEVMNTAGRYDIGLVSVANGASVYQGILELKVLRKNVNLDLSIKKGIEQAYAYAQELGAPWAQLCSFDMRNVHPDDDPYLDYRTEAEQLSVDLQRWYLFSSHDRYRAHLADVALRAGI